MKNICFLIIISLLISCSKHKKDINLNGSVTNFVTNQKIDGIQITLYKRLKHSSVSVYYETVQTILTDENGNFDFWFEHSDKYDYRLSLTDWRYFEAGYICPGAITNFNIVNVNSVQSFEFLTAAKGYLRFNFNVNSTGVYQDSLYVHLFTPGSIAYSVPFICFISDSSEFLNYAECTSIEGAQYAEFNFIKDGIDSTFIKNYTVIPNDTVIVEIDLY